LCLSLDILLTSNLFREMYIIMRQEKRRAARAAAAKRGSSQAELDALEDDDAPIGTYTTNILLMY